MRITTIIPLAMLITTANAQPPTQPTESSYPLPSIQETQNPDTVLREKVQNKITKLPILKNQTISAGVHDRVIVLEGSVETKAQERAAINAAKSVPGVKSVRSQLNIKLTND